MTSKYTEVNFSTEAKVHNGALYVKHTDMWNEQCLLQGGYADRVYKAPYSGTLEDAMREDPPYGVTDIERAMVGFLPDVKIIRSGWLIQ